MGAAGLEFSRQQTKEEDAVYVHNIFDDITTGLTNLPRKGRWDPL